MLDVTLIQTNMGGMDVAVFPYDDGSVSGNLVNAPHLSPSGLFFWGNVWTLVAWCELRKGHRQFRINRIQSLDVLPHTYQTTEAQTLQTFLLGVKSEGSCSS